MIDMILLMEEIPNNHLRCRKPCELQDQLPINWCRISDPLSFELRQSNGIQHRSQVLEAVRQARFCQKGRQEVVLKEYQMRCWYSSKKIVQFATSKKRGRNFWKINVIYCDSPPPVFDTQRIWTQRIEPQSAENSQLPTSLRVWSLRKMANFPVVFLLPLLGKDFESVTPVVQFSGSTTRLRALRHTNDER